MPSHAVIWIDHKEARVFHVHPDTVEASTVHAREHHNHNRPKGSEGGNEPTEEAQRFFHEVARSLDDSEAVLIVGPSTAKLEFFRYVHKHDHRLEQRVVGIETVDHPSDGQIVAYAKTYFKHSDRMQP